MGRNIRIYILDPERAVQDLIRSLRPQPDGFYAVQGSKQVYLEMPKAHTTHFAKATSLASRCSSEYMGHRSRRETASIRT